jgi:hypothetical protein
LLDPGLDEPVAAYTFEWVMVTDVVAFAFRKTPVFEWLVMFELLMLTVDELPPPALT